MRGTVPGLATPHPIGDTLPSLYAGDEFAQGLCQGLDEVFAPVLATLDCLPSYLDPGTAPADVLEWLASWIGTALTADMPEALLRRLVAAHVRLYVQRGTRSAITAIVQLATGHTPEIEESGGASWSQDPDGPFPGRPGYELVVRLPTGPPEEIRRLAALLTAFTPAHVAWRIELLPEAAETTR
jgi:phage tail-like protein